MAEYAVLIQTAGMAIFMLLGVLTFVGRMTKSLRGEIGGLRDEMRGEIGGLRGEIGGLRDEVHREISSLRDEVRDTNVRLGRVEGHLGITGSRSYKESG